MVDISTAETCRQAAAKMFSIYALDAEERARRARHSGLAPCVASAIRRPEFLVWPSWIPEQ